MKPRADRMRHRLTATKGGSRLPRGLRVVRLPRGLRTRLLVAFLLTAVFGAVLTAGFTFQRARSAILDRAQQGAVADLRAQLDSLAPGLTVPPAAADLRALSLQLDQAGGAHTWHSGAAYRDGPLVSASATAPPVPRQLRQAVRRDHRAVYQRFEHDGLPWLAVAMPVRYATASPSSDATDPPTAPGDPTGAGTDASGTSASDTSASGTSASGDTSAAGNEADSGDTETSGDATASAKATASGGAAAIGDAAATGDAAASGLTVYVSFPLDDAEADIAALLTAAETGAVPALVLALVPALFAARSVLRPVRRLHHGAERIAAGELDTRLDAQGHDELAALTRSFNTMAATLEKDAAELRRMEAGARRFAADVAHELRTPLAAMTAVTEVLDEDAASGTLPPDTADAVRLISDETRTLARMVEDLMEVSRFDARTAPLRPEHVDLRTLIAKSLRLRGWDGDERVTVDLAGPVPIRADPRRIDVVLANLVGNALRHARPPVVVRARAERDRAVLTVADHGPGIPVHALPHVFDRFYKADAARVRSEGSGLGLALARENALLHTGTLTAANAPHGGAVFTLTLPLAPSPPERP
jgi:two-component system sensor histidine kinase MtrB